ncbi:MAG: Outer membrane protein assembly factor BamB, contains PQQ-like beta-propeller repeat [Candidatus Midichloria mitochondrii]|nr:PQQ-binding-like beta-propeller repeat protein [Candidatus Midichloria mitochondrii]MDJ1256602.1 PQQ-like beta-propeller repeat protein [Candidatus Midichloria mitochondrii]MDJ1288322.1 PQQ-like beta-propeller repeat protein [Candidatus Midichloria mitochondrii]MDJ1299313.1 PQQ-like beta-propeller repeat protein [Candidatus Midichloria mitochondrii]MDJ1313272.1 PQQ-like beta-propeller repeat protein [Candidatus Midichloria mitochondrii]MDJ1583865.1 PQQ-like beta-propeller repeat protein [Ca
MQKIADYVNQVFVFELIFLMLVRYFMFLLSFQLLLSSCSVFDPNYNKEKLPGKRQKVFISNNKEGTLGRKVALTKRCTSLQSLDKIKLLAQKKIDMFQTLGVTNKPLITKDKVIILTSKGRLLAYNLDLNKKLWNKSLSSSLTTVGKIVEEDDILYVTYGINKLIAVDSQSGKEIWTAKFDDVVKGRSIIYGDKIFLHSAHNEIYALKKSDGTIIWRHIDTDHVQSTVADFAPVVYDKNVIFQVANNEIIALDIEKGTVSKIFVINNQYGFNRGETHKHIPNHFFIENNIIYATSKDGKFLAIDYKTQEELWQQEINSSAKFLVYGKLIYVITDKDELAVLNKKTGQIEYLVDLNSCIKLKNNYHKWTKPVIYNKNSILITSYDGYLLKFDIHSGKLLASIGDMEFVTSSPAVAGDYIYVVSNNGHIYKYR